MKQKFGKRVTALFLALALSVSVMPAAFAGDQDTGDLTVTVKPSSLSLETGDHKDVTVEISGTGAEQAEIAWTSENSKIATVQPSSVNKKIATVTAIGVGKTKVTVTVTKKDDGGEQKASCEVTVSAPDVEDIRLSQTNVALDKGKTEQLSVIFIPSTASAPVTWRSGDDSVAKVDQTGLVTGVDTGRTMIYATVGSREISCQVDVRGILINDPPATLKVGEIYSLKYATYGLGDDPGVSWESSDPDVVRVAVGGYCYALKEGTATIKAKVDGFSYEDTCNIKVKTNTAAVITPPGQFVAGAPLRFADITGEFQNRCSTVLDQSLQYISGLSVDDTRQGTLYYQYRSADDTGRGIAPSDTFYLNASTGQAVLDEVYFLPKPGFSGTATIRYTGYAGALSFFSGTIEVPVKEQQHLTYTASAGEPLQFRGDDFNTICNGTTGRNLKHVRFSLPDASRGALYRNYISPENPGIAVRDTDTFQYRGAPALSDLCFVPAVGYEGTVTLSYTATDVNGQTFRSRVEIQVKAQRPSGDVNYTVSQGGTVTLNKEDFTALCKDFTGGTLDYIRFMDLPPASQGTLYHDYSSASRPGAAVTTSQSYYASGSPRINKVTFAAADTGAGVVAIPFQGWDTRGNNFSGQVEISIRVSSAGDLRYTADRRGEAVFDGADFNTLCKDLTGKSLHYVQFSLPAASQGTLYRDRTGSSSGSKVSASQKFYYSGSPNLDKVTFVAASGFSGTASVSFTGWNQDGTTFTGVVSIQVRDSSGDGDPVTYTLRQGKSVTFDDGPFQSLCREETGQDLREVRFALPAAAWGTLYYDYKDGSGTKVTADRSYYRSRSPYLDRVSFVSEGKTGTFSIPFDGWSTGGETFAGSIRITVEENPDGTIAYTTSSAPVRFQPSDFLRACREQGLSEVASVSFTPPASNWGQLYYQYTGPLHYTSSVRPATAYRLTGSPALADISFVPKAETRGTVRIPYVATGTNGKTCAGTVQITLQPNTTSQHFTDLGRYSWAAAAVDYLYENGISTGTGNGRYQPAAAMTRGDFMVMLVRGLSLSATGDNFPDVPADSYYAQAVATAKALGIAGGYEDGTFRPRNTLSRQEAMVFLQRALQAAGWYLGDGSEATLALFPDGGQVAGFARGAVAAMVERGILYGSSGGKLNPRGSLTRAEMAVLLHRSLTL